MIKRQDNDLQTILYLEGKLDLNTSFELDRVKVKLVDEKRLNIILDMSGLKFIDDAGVAEIVRLYKHIQANGGQIKVQGARDQPLSILKLLRIDRVFGL